MTADPEADDLHVGPGDVLLFPPDLPQLARNPGMASASALSLLVAPNDLVFQQVRAGTTTQMTIAGIHDGWRVGSRTAWDNAIISQPLAVKHLPLNQELASISLGGIQVSLEPGQRQPPLPPGKLRLAIVRSGVVDASVSNSDTVPISLPNPNSMLATAVPHLFRTGDAFWIEASEAPILANAGITPLDILIVEIAMHGDGVGATQPAATTPEFT
jgi:hypothetical protein